MRTAAQQAQKLIVRATRLSVPFLIALGGFGGQCDGTAFHDTTQGATGCKAKQAMIEVMDGMFRNLCGCQESTGQMILYPQKLQCTIGSDSQIFFYFHLAKTRHQIVSVGKPSFDSAPPFEPTGRNLPAYVYRFKTPGTYAFEDAVDNSLSGSIIVQ